MAIKLSGLGIRSSLLAPGNAQAYLDLIDQNLEAVGWHCPSNNSHDCQNDPSKKLIYATAVLSSQEHFGGPGNGDVIVYAGQRIGWNDPTSPAANFPSGADVWVQLGATSIESMINMSNALPQPNSITQDPGPVGNIHITILSDAHIGNGISLGGTLTGHVTWDQPYTYGGGYILWSLPMIGTLAQIQVQMTVPDYEHGVLSFVFADASELITFTSAVFAPRMPILPNIAQIICSGWQFYLFLLNDTAGQCGLLASLPSRDTSLGKLIVVLGSDDGNQNLRTALYTAGKYWSKVGNSSNTVIPPNQDPRIMQFVLPTIGSQAPGSNSIMGSALMTSDEGSIPAEPFIAVSIDGSSRSVVVGQLWDSYLINKDATLDQSGTISGYNAQCVGSDSGSGTRTTGSFWMIVP